MTEKKPAPPAAPTPIDPHLVETLGEIANRLDLSEIEVAQGELKIKVKRVSATARGRRRGSDPAAHQPQAAAPRRRTRACSRRLIAASAIKSPMVGTAYLRPSPESPPFISIGAQVKAGDKLLLIEAMKTFNEIVAPQGRDSDSDPGRRWPAGRIRPAPRSSLNEQRRR